MKAAKHDEIRQKVRKQAKTKIRHVSTRFIHSIVGITSYGEIRKISKNGY